MFFVLWGIVFVAGTWIIATYNSLTALRLRVHNAWHQINVQLKRRNDSIADLVKTLKGEINFEQDTLQSLIEARNTAMVVTGVKQAAEAQSRLGESLGQVLALIENQPDLKSNKEVLDFQDELSTRENHIAIARQYYNDLVAQYNTKQQAFPGNLISGFFKFQPSELFSTARFERTILPKANVSLPR